MQSMPRHTVRLAGGVLALSAAAGLYLGLSRSLATPPGTGDETGVIVAPVTPVASAKPILTPPPTLDETEVRRLAREEAQAVLARSQAKKAEDKDEDEIETPDQLTPAAPPPAITPIKPLAPASSP